MRPHHTHTRPPRPLTTSLPRAPHLTTPLPSARQVRGISAAFRSAREQTPTTAAAHYTLAGFYTYASTPPSQVVMPHPAGAYAPPLAAGTTTGARSWATR